MNIQEFIYQIGIPLTFLGTMINIYYTRRNLKTSKYIDTITSERIKWLEKIRLDLSELAVMLFVLSDNSNKQRNVEIEYDEIEEASGVNNPYNDNIGSHYSNQLKELKNEKIYLNEEMKNIPRSKIIEKIYLLKLRLNPNDDKLIIVALDRLLNHFNDNIFSVEKNKEIMNLINEIILASQKLLKNEWDKVKKEVKKGK